MATVTSQRNRSTRYSDAQLRDALMEFAAECGRPVNFAVWNAWADEDPRRPLFAVLKRRLGYEQIAAISGVALDDSRQRSRRQLSERRNAARRTLREAAELLGRAPRRAELDPERAATHPDRRVRHRSVTHHWMPAAEISEAYGRSWPNALEDAGIEPLGKREEIVLALIDYRERFGKWPSRSDVAMDRARRTPSSFPEREARYRLWGGPIDDTIMRHFGSVAAAVSVAREQRPDLSHRR